jgi:hypothetical protein
MKFLLLLVSALMGQYVFAGSSSIFEVEGYSCMGSDFSRKETERMALQDAKRRAIEFSKTHIESVTEMEDFALKRDWVESYSSAQVKVLSILSSIWDAPERGDCFNLTIRAEVVPSEQNSKRKRLNDDDPRLPLDLKVWSNADRLKAGESLKIYLQANKPFFGRIIYTDAAGELLQLLPNPHRTEDYFQGGVRYEVPSGLDRFSLIVRAPYGQESVTVYGSTQPLGDIDTQTLGAISKVNTDASKVPIQSRAMATKAPLEGADNPVPRVVEFAESTILIQTEP